MKEEKEIPTASAFLRNFCYEQDGTFKGRATIQECMIEFAKIHIRDFKNKLLKSPHVLLSEREIEEMFPESNIK